VFEKYFITFIDINSRDKDSKLFSEELWNDNTRRKINTFIFLFFFPWVLSSLEMSFRFRYFLPQVSNLRGNKQNNESVKRDGPSLTKFQFIRLVFLIIGKNNNSRTR